MHIEIYILDNILKLIIIFNITNLQEEKNWIKQT